MYSDRAPEYFVNVTEYILQYIKNTQPTNVFRRRQRDTCLTLLQYILTKAKWYRSLTISAHTFK